MEADKKTLGLELAKELYALHDDEVNRILQRVWSKEELDDYVLKNIKSLADVHKYMADIWGVSPMMVSSTPTLEKKINAFVTVQNIVTVLNHACDNPDPESLWFIEFEAVEQNEFYNDEFYNMNYQYLDNNIAYRFDSWDYNTLPLGGYPLNGLRFESKQVAEHFLKYFKNEISSWLNG